MRIAYTVLEVDRHENAKLIREKLSFLNEMKTVVCDARKEYPDCIKKYPQYKHIFDSLTNTGFIGLWISNLNAFYSLLESDYDAILIFEDDAVLVDDFELKFKRCLEELPTDFGLFSIGYRDLYLNSYSEAHSIQKDNVCRMFQTGDSWGILYKKEFVQELLDRIIGHKILYGLPDTAIMSYALGNVKPFTNYKPYSTTPSLGSLIFHNNDKSVSSIDSSI